MLSTLKKTPARLGLLFVGLALLVAGCDSTGPSVQKDKKNENPWTVTNDLGSRITHFGGSSANATTNAVAKSATPSFTVTDWVEAPDKNGDGNRDRASHLSLSTSNDMLYIGYKVQGAGYGGGIDIVEANSSGLQPGNGSNSLTSDGLDVQELTVSNTTGALFVATADDPESGFSSPSQFHSVNLDGSGLPKTSSGVEYEEAEFPGTLVKSVVTGPASGGSGYEAFAVSDVNSFHQINIGGGDNYTIQGVDTKEASSGTNFRSVANQNGTAYALSDGGNIYAFGGLGAEPPLNDSPLATLSGNSIARMSAHRVDVDNDDKLESSEWFLFVALNDGGFRVFDTSQGQNGEVVYSDPDIYATSVTASRNHVYVANGDGIALYEVKNTLTSTNTNEGLEDLGRASVSDFNISGGSVPTPTNAQINHILVDDKGNFDMSDNVLYLAKSTDGVFRVEQNASSGDY